MCKKLLFLISFVLVLCLSGATEAVTDINVVNPSFELDIDGDQITCSGAHNVVDMLGWDSHGGWTGVTIDCGAPGACDDCWPHENTTGFPDGYIIAWMEDNVGAHIYQHLDSSDANAVITAGRQYTLSWYGLAWWNQALDATLFYGDDHDANELVTITQDMAQGGETPWDWFYGELKFVVEAGQPYLGETLGIKFTGNHPTKLGDNYSFMDDVHLTRDYATYAYAPYPADGETDVPKTATLNWKSGTYTQDVNGHHVYFGTSYAEVYDANTNTAGICKGAQNRDANSYSPGTLELGKTYYWRIDEVNDAHTTPPPPVGPWKGDVRSFEVTGYATNPKPENGATDVSMYTDISWTPGTDSNSHDVYFGTSWAEVDDANQLSSEYMGNQDANDFSNSNLIPALELTKTYYWRIDEVNGTAGTLIKGELWSFTVENYLVVDDMDSYADTTAIKAVWKDYWSDPSPAAQRTGSDVFLETDPNYIIDGRSMRYYFRNLNKKANKFVGSEAEADTTDLEVGTDWVTGGVEAMVLYFYGDATNLGDTSGVVGGIHQDQMYVALEDGSANVGVVRWPDMNAITEEEWHEWNIDLADPCLADVNLANVMKVYIGFGGQKIGQTERGAGDLTLTGDTVWFDDIRLYPPRCVPEFAPANGSFGHFNDYETVFALKADCFIDYHDLRVMARDWLMSGIGMVTATAPSTTALVGHWKLDDDVVGGPALAKAKVVDSSVNGNDGLLYDDIFQDEPKLGVTGNHHIDESAEGTGALTFDGIDDFVEIPALNLNSNTVTISAWIKQDVDQIPECRYGGIVFSSDANTTAGICLGSSGEPEWLVNNELCYFWHEFYWEWHSELMVPPDIWCFVALVVEPTKATIYLHNGVKLLASRHYADHSQIEEFDGFTHIGDQMQFAERFFKGAIDDVRIYNRSLSPSEILYLSIYPDTSGSQYLELEPWRTDANDDDKVDLKDYSIMANNWLKEIFWP